MGLPVTIVPLPPKAQPVDEEPVPQAKRSVWDAHFGLFLTIIILLAVCIIVTIICCICLKCRARDDSEKVNHCLGLSLVSVACRSELNKSSTNCFRSARYRPI